MYMCMYIGGGISLLPGGHAGQHSCFIIGYSSEGHLADTEMNISPTKCTKKIGQGCPIFIPV